MLVFLIGFSGSGKTTLGKALAQQLKYKFADTDSAVELLTKKTITNLFETKGEDYFRLKEQEVLHSFKAKKNCVIATGGGLPSFGDNMKWMNEHGTTIYLKLHRGILFHRLLPDKKNRPLLAQLDDVALMEFIMEKLPQRNAYYKQAKIIVDGENLTADELLQALKRG